MVVNDELEIMLLGSPRLCVGSGPKPFSGALYRIGVRPVSYTHLDVYKRQPMIMELTTKMR